MLQHPPPFPHSHQTARAARHRDDDSPGQAVTGGQDLDQAALVGDADGDRGLAVLLGQVSEHPIAGVTSPGC